MKTKVNVPNEIENLVKKMNAVGEDGTFLCLYNNDEKKDFSLTLTGEEDSELIATLASIITMGYNGNFDKKHGISRLAHSIVEAVGLAVSNDDGTDVSNAVVRDIVNMWVIKKEFNNITDEIDDDDREDCEHCDNNRTCPLPDAIAYRKANGIRKPKNKKKGGRKVDVN